MSSTYTTILGDQWDMIAYKVYGNENYMDTLLKANEVYKDVSIFGAGVSITCPEIPTVSSDILPPWKG